MFVGRDYELGLLAAELDRPRPSLMVVYGRRRIGKSRLLREAVTDRPALYFQATRVEAALNLRSFIDEVVKILGEDPYLQAAPDWYTAFLALARHAEARPGLTIVLDEFPYLTDSDVSIASQIQKVWDSGVAATGRLNLILCGSQVSQMEDILAERNPLYGRKTFHLDVGPLPIRDAAHFFPGFSAIDAVTAYGIFGGVPFYLENCDPDLSLEDNVKRLLLTEGGTLVDEPDFLLQSELREPRRYASVLAAIAAGCTTTGEIAGRCQFAGSGELGPYLQKLRAMRLIRSVRPMGASPKSRDYRHVIEEPLLSFYYRFVLPARSSIARGQGADVWTYRIAPHLATYMGLPFERICREHVRWHIQEWTGVSAGAVGQFWAADYDIDIVGETLDGAGLYGECKWWTEEVGLNVLDQLRERAAACPYQRDPKTFLLFARSGFTPDLEHYADSRRHCVLATPETLVRPVGG